MDARVPDGRLTGRYPLPPSRLVLRSLSVASEVQASCTHEHRVLTAFVRTKCSCGGRADRVDVGLTGILVRLLRLLSSSNCHCLIQKNSNQPAAKSAFLQECPRCSRFIEPTRIEHHSCRHHMLRTSHPLRFSRQ